MSALESRHKAPITDIQWLPSTFEVHGGGGAARQEGSTAASATPSSLGANLVDLLHGVFRLGKQRVRSVLQGY